MTKVHVILDDDGYCCLTAKGHATGSTEVCAGISSILYAAAGYLANAEDEGSVEVDQMQMDSGDVILAATGDERLNAVFRATLIGLMQLEKAEPGYLEVDYELR